MDKPFRLPIRVEQINRPDDIAPLNEVSLRVTLSHNFGDLKSALWITSENYHLKPIFVSFQYQDLRVEDASTIGAVLESQTPEEALSACEALVVKIDYTLLGSPFIPNREPIPTLFNLEVVAGPRVVALRELLSLTVASVKEQVQHAVDGAFELELETEKSELLSAESTLSEVLALDLPPLDTVHLRVVRGRRFEVRNIGTQETCIVSGESVAEVRAALAAQIHVHTNDITLYVGPHLLTDTEALESIPASAEVLYEIRSGLEHVLPAVRVDGDVWRPSGRTFVSVTNSEGVERLVAAEALSSQTYEIEVDGQRVQLSPSECVVGDRSVMVSPAGAARLRRLIKGGFRTERREEGSGEGDTEAEEDARESAEGNESDSTARDTAEGNESDSTARETATENTTGDYTQNELRHRGTNIDGNNGGTNVGANGGANVGANVGAGNGNFAGDNNHGGPRNMGQNLNDTLARRLEVALRRHWPALRGVAVQVLFAGLMFGFDMLRFMAQPQFLVPLALFLLYMVLFVWGDGVCSWVDEHLLAGAPDRWDFRAVRAGRAVVHLFYSAGARAEEAAFSVVAAAADKLATPPHEHHAIVASGRDTIAYHLVRAAKEAARHGIFFVALFSPALLKRLEEYLLRQHEREKEQITARAQGASDAVRARVEALLGPFAEALHNEPVRCYVEVLRAEKEVHEQHEQMEEQEQQVEEQEQQVEHDSTDTQAEPVEVH